MIKKFSGPLYFRLPGNENLPITLPYNPLQGNALSLSLLGLSYPFKTESIFLVPLILVYCLYDPCVASILCTTKMGFQFSEQIEVRRSHIRRVWGLGRISNPNSVASVMATCDVWAGALSCKRRTPRFSFPHFFLAIPWRSRLNSFAYYSQLIVRPCSS